MGSAYADDPTPVIVAHLGGAENSVTLPNGDIIVSGAGLQRIARTTHEVTTFATAEAPGGLVLQGNRLFFLAGNTPSNAIFHQGRLESIDLATGERTVHLSGLSMVNGLTSLPDGSLAYSVTVDPTGVGIYRTSPDKSTTRRISTAVPGPNGLTTGPDGQVYAASMLNATITRINPDSGAASVVASGMPVIDDLTYASDGSIYAASTPGTVYRVDPATGAHSPVATGLLGATAAKVYDADTIIVTSLSGTVWTLDV